MEFFEDFTTVEVVVEQMASIGCSSAEVLWSTLKEKGRDVPLTLATEVFSAFSPEVEFKSAECKSLSSGEENYGIDVDEICIQSMTPPSLPTSVMEPLHAPAPTPAPAMQADRKTRRKVKRWSQTEEETLKQGVEKYGEGNWKTILHSNLDVFDRRTTVDLKDKWRNIRKKEHRDKQQ